jgi:hypothetical protein
MTGPVASASSASKASRSARQRPTSRRRDSRPPQTGHEEKDVLLSFLDYLRSSVAAKADGVPEPEVRTPGVPSGTSLLGLIKHLTHVERRTFLGEDVTDWPATFHAAPEESADDVLTGYRDAIDQANQVIATCADLTEPTPGPSAGKNTPSMRWALVHMIEETGRHAGHADILRELIDGRTGR